MDGDVEGGGVSIKEVPYWFGPKGFEDAVRKAAFDLVRVTGDLYCHETNKKIDDS